MSKKNWIWVVVAILVVLAVMFVTIKVDKGEKTKPQQSGDTAKQNSIKEYKALEELPIEYTVEEAKNDNCFVVTENIETYNLELMKLFLKDANEGKLANIRVVENSIDNILYITDVKYENGMITITTDSRRNPKSEEGIFTNQYELEKYKLEEVEEKLEEGASIFSFRLTSKENPDEVVYLGAYLVIPEVVVSGDEISGEIISGE